MVRKRIHRGRQAVSPVIGTILMVAITVMVSGVLLVLVLGMMDPEGVSPTGVLDVKKDGQVDDRFEISIKAMTFSIPAEEAFLTVNGQKPIRALDSYPASKPFSGNGFTFNTGQTSLTQIGTGSRFYLDMSDSLRGSVITVQLMKQNGAVMASIKFFDNSNNLAERPTIEMSGATYKNDDPANFPLEFVGADRQHVRIPQSDIGTVTRYFNVTCEVELNSPPSQQQSWATIININGDNGYRLQLSGTKDNNKHFEFGAGTGSNWVRSDGTGGGVATEIREGVRYQVWGVLDFELKKVSIWVNATDGSTMVLAGIKDYNRDILPNIGSADWHLGSTSTDARHFDGTVHWLNVETS